MLRRVVLGLLLIATPLQIAACGGASSATPPPEATAPATAAATLAPATPAATTAAEQTAAPTALDPCQLVTASEASALAGASFSAGKAETTSGGAKVCVYGGATLNVFTVIVTQAPDAATAQADWATEQSRAQQSAQQGVPAGVNLSFKLTDVTSVPGADRAAVATASASIAGQTIGISAIYVLKGATFFSFSDLVLGKAPPAASDLEAQAVVTLGRVP